MTGDLPRLIKLSEVKSMTSLGTTKIYEMMGEGKFPRPLKITPQCVRWREGDVAAWINSLPSN